MKEREETAVVPPACSAARAAERRQAPTLAAPLSSCHMNGAWCYGCTAIIACWTPHQQHDPRSSCVEQQRLDGPSVLGFRASGVHGGCRLARVDPYSSGEQMTIATPSPSQTTAQARMADATDHGGGGGGRSAGSDRPRVVQVTQNASIPPQTQLHPT
jgi:hypothetical protein